MCVSDRQKDRRTDSQTYTENIQTDIGRRGSARSCHQEPVPPEGRQADRQTAIQADIQKDRQSYRQAYRHSNTQADSQA